MSLPLQFLVMPLDYLLQIAQTPAPTFEEGARADLITRLWEELGYPCERDEVGNVVTRIVPAGAQERPALALLVHLDTVFSAETDVSVTTFPDKLVGAGVGDNSASLAVVTAFLRDLGHAAQAMNCPLWVVANVGEEGLGDLRGAKHFLAQHHKKLGAVLAVDGYLGMAVTKAVGVKRYRAAFGGAGGHSWGDQSPSSLHALGVAIAGLYALHLPSTPRTTLNVGQVQGGTSVNTIASHAELLLDLRSLDADILASLEEKAQGVLHRAAQEVGVKLRLEQVGHRPGGELRAGKLLDMARLALSEQRLELRQTSSSTDANAAIPHGVPALTLGVYKGGNAHRTDEWVQISSLSVGLRVLQRVVQLYGQRPVV